jgi:hypothetical protein
METRRTSGPLVRRRAGSPGSAAAGRPDFVSRSKQAALGWLAAAAMRSDCPFTNARKSALVWCSDMFRNQKIISRSTMSSRSQTCRHVRFRRTLARTSSAIDQRQSCPRNCLDSGVPHAATLCLCGPPISHLIRRIADPRRCRFIHSELWKNPMVSKVTLHPSNRSARSRLPSTYSVATTSLD